MTIGIWGDSITYGAGDVEALGWVGRVRKAHAPTDADHIYNFGVCGESSADVLRRFPIEAEAIKPHRVAFAVGMNDAKLGGSGGRHVELSDFQNNVTELIHRARAYTQDIVLVGITCVPDEWDRGSAPRFSNDAITAYNDALRTIAEREGCVLVDVFTVLDPAHDLADSVHPNARGYERLAEAIGHVFVQ